MKEITGINHVGLRVSHLGITREFYEKLGFEFIVGPVGPEPVAIMEHPSGVNINFILNGSDNIKLNLPTTSSSFTNPLLLHLHPNQTERDQHECRDTLLRTVKLQTQRGQSGGGTGIRFWRESNTVR